MAMRQWLELVNSEQSIVNRNRHLYRFSFKRRISLVNIFALNEMDFIRFSFLNSFVYFQMQIVVRKREVVESKKPYRIFFSKYRPQHVAGSNWQHFPNCLREHGRMAE